MPCKIFRGQTIRVEVELSIAIPSMPRNISLCGCQVHYASRVPFCRVMAMIQSGNGTHWVCDAFRYGYVDNVSNSDIDGCSFDISWAVDKNRKPVALDHIDFVRVYSAQNQMCGWLGETSTEVGSGAEDLHLQKSISARVERDNK